MPHVCVLDFETSGLRTTDRAIEVAVVRVDLEDGEIVQEYQSLMNPGIGISSEIVRITGIRPHEVTTAPPSADVMRRVVQFIGRAPVLAHHANFDRRFFLRELDIAGLRSEAQFFCTLELARRLYRLPRYRLRDVAEHLGVRFEGRSHRALADATVTAKVFLHMHRLAEERHNVFLDTNEDFNNFLQPNNAAPEPRAINDVNAEPQNSDRIILLTIEKALESDNFLSFDYVNQDEEISLQREVKPLRLESNRRGRYLIAYCFLRLEERTFCVNRIDNVRIMKLTEVN